MDDSPRGPDPFDVRLTAGDRDAAAGASKDSPDPRAPYVKEEPVFSILVLGDLSGTPPDGPRATWTPVRATPDNVPDLAGFRPSIDVRLTSEARSKVELSRLEDLDPDRLFETHPAFRDLREARAAVREGRVPEIAPETQGPSSAPLADQALAPGAEAAESSIPAADEILDRIVARSESSPTESSGPLAEGELQAFVREVVRPHLVRPEPDRSADLAAVDATVSDLMRRFLSDPRFQAVESLWRGIVFLLSRIDTTGKVRVYLVDVPREELVRDLLDSDDLLASRLTRLLGRPEAAGGPRRWALAVGGYQFGPDDAPILEFIARAAAEADVPWISGATEGLAAVATDDGSAPAGRADWDALRETPESRWLGLACPRFLAREPWGSEFARPTRAFSFAEEIDDAPAARARPLPWASGAFPVAVTLARGFARGGGSAASRDLDLTQLPLTPSRDDDPRPTSLEARVEPATAGRLQRAGFMSLVEFPDEARIRVAGLRSISAADPEIAAWWRGSRQAFGGR